jgi:2-polyprenyl-6-methoxyphenol hydroxylase-like FAD-dependent oxidoreductase
MEVMVERETMEFDVLIVGGGPAGLSAACRLMQMAQQEQRQLSVCVIEKGLRLARIFFPEPCSNPGRSTNSSPTGSRSAHR